MVLIAGLFLVRRIAQRARPRNRLEKAMRTIPRRHDDYVIAAAAVSSLECARENQPATLWSS
jgi:hypothetical protein